MTIREASEALSNKYYGERWYVSCGVTVGKDPETIVLYTLKVKLPAELALLATTGFQDFPVRIEKCGKIRPLTT